MTIPFFNKVGIADKAFFARQIATMLSSGITIDKALQIVISQTKNQYFKKVLENILTDLEGGSPFSAAISKHPEVFDKVFINIVVSGEAVGKLSEVLTKLADRLENDRNFIAAIRNAMAYPLLVLIVMISIVILMAIKVLPELESVFAEFQSQLPWTTRTLMGISHFLIAYWWLVLLVLISIIAFLYYWLKTAAGMRTFNRLEINFPGGLGQDVYMARFCRTLGMLIESGTPIIDALKITADVMNNQIYKDFLLVTSEKIERGLPLSEILQKSEDFPVIVPQMVLVGEKTGKVDEVLLRLADYYEDRSNAKVKNFASLAEPILIVIIGIGVGFVVFSIIMPIYNLAQIQ